MSNTPPCSVCGANEWKATKQAVTYSYRGEAFTLADIEHSVCRQCGFDVVLPEQSRHNESRIRDEHRKIDGLLTGTEIRAIRKSLGLSQQEAARFFGGGDNAFSKYERGEITQSIAMDRLLRVARSHPYILNTLLAIAGTPPSDIKELRGRRVHMTIDFEMSYGEMLGPRLREVKSRSEVQEVLDEQVLEDDGHLEAA